MGKAAKKRDLPKWDKLDKELDQALAQTFPASDPVAIGHSTATEPAARPTDRKAPLIAGDDVTAAQRAR